MRDCLPVGNMGPMTQRRYVAHETVEGIAHVRLTRPDKLNALTLQTLDELVATARELRRDRTLRAVVLSGEGASFCAGLDFASALKSPAGIVKAFVPAPWRGTNTFQEACWAWRRLPVPVIAAVDGHCYGGGLQIALAADFRVATPDSEWSVLEARWGLIPDMTGIRSLAELVGIDTAKRLTMTATMLSGKEAADLGPGGRRPRPGPGDRPALAGLRGRGEAAVQQHLDLLAAGDVRPRARRAAAAARRGEHPSGAHRGVQEGAGRVRPPRPAQDSAG